MLSTGLLAPLRGSARDAAPETAAAQIVTVLRTTASSYSSTQRPGAEDEKEAERAHSGRFLGKDEMEERIADALDAMGWEKVLVAMPGLVPGLAHNRIAALSRSDFARWFNRAGLPVVEDVASYLGEPSGPLNSGFQSRRPLATGAAWAGSGLGFGSSSSFSAPQLASAGAHNTGVLRGRLCRAAEPPIRRSAGIPPSFPPTLSPAFSPALQSRSEAVPKPFRAKVRFRRFLLVG